MAGNVFALAQKVADIAVTAISGDLILGGTVNRDGERNFTSGVGASVSIRKPAVLTANHRPVYSTAQLVMTTITESFDTLSLTDHAYSAVQLSLGDITLSLSDFAVQILAPQTRAVAEAAEKALIDAFNAVAVTDVSGDDVVGLFVSARKILRDNKLPMTDLYAAVGTGAYAELLGKLRPVDFSGDNTALRAATVGRLHGFQVVESNELEDDDIFWYHRDAATLATVAPVVPRGATAGASANSEGINITAIFDYDSNNATDRSLVSTFTGAKVHELAPAKGAPDNEPAVYGVIHGKLGTGA